jgi:mono/diheme cytochrome c family protein
MTRRIAFIIGTIGAVVTGVAMGLGAFGAPAAAPVRITMEELHRHGGVPPGWRFSFPAGDPGVGRRVFAKLECYTCHAVEGESFPGSPGQSAGRGPALTGMGGHHPAEYLAESILNPNAVIVTGPGHTGSDGRSVMPDYHDTLSVGELVDLVAYVKSLGAHREPHHRPAGGARTVPPPGAPRGGTGHHH